MIGINSAHRAIISNLIIYIVITVWSVLMECNAVLYGQSNCLNSGKDADTKKVESAAYKSTRSSSVYPAEDLSHAVFNMVVSFYRGGDNFFFFSENLEWIEIAIIKYKINSCKSCNTYWVAVLQMYGKTQYGIVWFSILAFWTAQMRLTRNKLLWQQAQYLSPKQIHRTKLHCCRVEWKVSPLMH